MKAILIQGARIIDPSQGLDEMGSLLLDNGKVAWLGKGDERPPEQLLSSL